MSKYSDLFPRPGFVAGLCCIAMTGLVMAAPISVAPNGAPANGPSADPRLTPDGRYIIYHSVASNLTPLDTGDSVNVYVYDNVQRINSIVSIGVNPGTSPIGDGPSLRADISDDGRLVVFESAASNLVPGDTEGRTDIFLHDRWTGSLERITAGTSGDSHRPRIAGDGRSIVFQSDARITAADSDSFSDIYRYDLQSGSFMLVSIRADGRSANGDSVSPVISADGSMIAFESVATDLVPNDDNSASDVFLFDVSSSRVKLVSAADISLRPDGMEINGPITAAGDSVQPAISGDGRWIAFASSAHDLAPGDHNGKRDIFVCDGMSGTVQLITRNFFGEQANGDSERPDISEHGRFVGFESDATNLTLHDDNGIRDAFMIELPNGQIGRISAPASEVMTAPSGFGTVSVAAAENNDPPVFGELPGGFGETDPGDDDDGSIIPGVCNLSPGCEATDINGVPTTTFSLTVGQPFRFTMTGRTLCMNEVLTLELLSYGALPDGAVHSPELPTDGQIDRPVSADFEWTPTAGDIGSHTLRYAVLDSAERMGYCEITLNVGSCDDRPTCDIDYAGPLTIPPGESVSFTLTAQGFCDDQPVLVESLNQPMGAIFTPSLPTFSNGGAPVSIDVQWTPTIDDVGQQREFLFRTTDVFGQTTDCGLTFEVMEPTCNFDPECRISGPTQISASPGELITFDITGTSACPDQALTIDTTSLPSGALLSPMTPVTGDAGADVMTTFTWTPTADDMGAHEATFTITDNLGRESSCTVNIDVSACPEPPVCESPSGDNFIIFMNETVTFSIIGASECPDAILTLDSDSLPDGAVVLEGLPLVGDPGQPVVGTFQWTPDTDGVFNFDFTVTDQTGQASVCAFEVSVVDCDLLPELTVDPSEPFLVAPGDFVTFTADGATQCPKTGLLLDFDNVPDGAQIIPNPILESGPDEDVGAIFEWTPADSDIGQDFTVGITLTDSFGRSVQDQIEISVSMVCLEYEINDTPADANLIDADCEYFSGKLQKNPVIVCEPDTYLTLFDKAGNIINRDDNGSDLGNGWASGLTDLVIRNDNAPRPFGDGGDGLINNGDGSYSLRLGVTGRADGLDGLFNGLFLNNAHGQLGAFEVTVTFKNINGNLIVPMGFPASASMENPVSYEDVFITGAEAFRINFTAPLGTALVDVHIDNLIAVDTVCNDVDFFLIRGLIPLCDYCITQVGGIDWDCKPTDLNLGWFDKLGNLIDSDDNSGPVPGYADLCIVADANGHALIGVTGTGDNNFNGLADAWEDASSRAPSICNEPIKGHGICGCYTLCIRATGPHAPTPQTSTLEAQSFGDLNGDGRIDTADLGQLLGMMNLN